MTFYPPKIAERSFSPQHSGKGAGTNGVGTAVNFACGSFVRFYLGIDFENSEIRSATFKTNGCGFAIAVAELLAARINGENLTGLHGLDGSEFHEGLIAELGELPAGRGHCLEIGLEALRSALADHRALRIEEFRGEKALICTCFGVSEEKIEGVISELSLETVEQVGDVCNAGRGCGSCRMLIQEMLDHGV
jgi:NifU-like protein